MIQTHVIAEMSWPRARRWARAASECELRSALEYLETLDPWAAGGFIRLIEAELIRRALPLELPAH